LIVPSTPWICHRGQSVGGTKAFADAGCELEREHADAD
jgi:hypothetical protein